MGYNIEKYKDRSELEEFTLKDHIIDNYTIKERFGINSFTKLDALFFTLYAYYEKQINDKKLRVLIDNLMVSERTYLTNEIYVFFENLYNDKLNQIKFYLRKKDILRSNELSKSKALTYEYLFFISKFYLEVAQKYILFPASNLDHFFDENEKEKERIVNHFQEIFKSRLN